MAYVGQSVRRKEDRRLLMGGGRFAADVALPGLLHAAFLRSDLPRARVLSVDIAAAEAMPGVVAVYVGGRFVSTEPPAWLTVHGPDLPIPFRPLAGDEVRFVGDPIALVVAENRYLAEDACELIDVQFEPLEPVFDTGSADADESGELVHRDHGSNRLTFAPMVRTPELDEVMATSRVIEATIQQHRWNAVPMECRGITATWDAAAEELDIVMGAQSVHEVRLWFARYLGISDTQVTVRGADVGGAFGQKKIGREEVAVVLAAHTLGRSVQWIEDRRENLLAATHSRKERANVKMAIGDDGLIKAMTVENVVEVGAYPVTIHGMTAFTLHATGAYKIPHYAVASETRLTNTMGRGSYRAPGMFETTAREMMMDVVAHRLGVDPVELRRRHLLHGSELPYKNTHGYVLEEIAPAEVFEKALEQIGYDSFRMEQQAARREGRFLGLGVSIHVAGYAKDGPTFSTDAAFVRIEPGGHATVYVGVTDQGMSLRTTLAQIAADQLGLDVAHVSVIQGDSHSTPFGPGTGGSKSAILAGGAVHTAAGEVRDKLFAIAAQELEVDVQDLEAEAGKVFVRGTPSANVTIADLARMAYVDPVARHPKVESGLEAVHRFRPTRWPTWSNGAHACIVEIDPATCIPRILRYVAVEDCGSIINPTIVEGQVRGAVVQGVGGVLYEHFVYDEAGNPLTSTLVDYLLPTAAEAPEVEVTFMPTPSTTNPGGFKGVAENGTLSSPAAVANAIGDALAPLGVSVTSTNLGPNEIFALMQSAGAL